MRPAQILAFLAAGLVAPFLWTIVEMYLISWLPIATSWVMWRGIQVFVGFVAVSVVPGGNRARITASGGMFRYVLYQFAIDENSAAVIQGSKVFLARAQV